MGSRPELLNVYVTVSLSVTQATASAINIKDISDIINDGNFDARL